MDALYLYRTSPNGDEEIRYSLRSLHRHAPWIRRAFVLGDRPAFLDESPRVRHVSYESMTPQLGIEAPAHNFFLMLLAGSLIPEIDYEFLFFCDDFIFLRDVDEDFVRRDRCLGELRLDTRRGRGLWKDSLWRTAELLARLGYPVFNFETHVPTYFTRRRVWDAYGAFRDFVTEDRWYGMLGPTAILNHAMKSEGKRPRPIADEGCRVGYWGRPPVAERLIADCSKPEAAFLNFDDDAYGPEIARFLKERFPDPAPWEKANGRENESPIPAPALWFSARA